MWLVFEPSQTINHFYFYLIMQLHHQLLRRTQVQELTGLSKTSIYKRMNEGNFPQSIALSSKLPQNHTRQRPSVDDSA